MKIKFLVVTLIAMFAITVIAYTPTKGSTTLLPTNTIAVPPTNTMHTTPVSTTTPTPPPVTPTATLTPTPTLGLPTYILRLPDTVDWQINPTTANTTTGSCNYGVSGQWSVDQWENAYPLCLDQNTNPEPLFCTDEGEAAGWTRLTYASYVCWWQTGKKLRLGLNTNAQPQNGCVMANNSTNGGYVLGAKWQTALSDIFAENTIYKLTNLRALVFKQAFKTHYANYSNCPPQYVNLLLGNVPTSQFHTTVILTKIVEGAGVKVLYYQVNHDNRPTFQNPNNPALQCTNPLLLIYDDNVSYYNGANHPVTYHTYTFSILDRVKQAIATCANDTEYNKWFVTGVYYDAEALNTANVTHTIKDPILEFYGN